MMVIVYRPGFKELYQTDKEFAERPNIRHYGCFVTSILRAMAVHFDLPFTHSIVADFISDELIDSDKDITNEMVVEDAQNLIDDFVGPGKVKFLSFLPGNTHFPPDCSISAAEFSWGCYHRTGTNFNHFVQIDMSKMVAFDPWGGGSLSVAKGQRISIRKALLLT